MTLYLCGRWDLDLKFLVSVTWELIMDFVIYNILFDRLIIIILNIKKKCLTYEILIFEFYLS